MKDFERIIEKNWSFILFLLVTAIWILQIISLLLTPAVAVAFFGLISSLLLFWVTKEKEIDEKVRVEKIRSYQDFMDIFAEVVSLSKKDVSQEQLEKLVKATNKLTLIAPNEVINKVRLYNESFIMSWLTNREIHKEVYLDEEAFLSKRNNQDFINEAKNNDSLILLYRKSDTDETKIEYQIVRVVNDSFSVLVEGTIGVKNRDSKDSIYNELGLHLTSRFDGGNADDTANLISAIRDDIKIKNKEDIVLCDGLRYTFIRLPKRAV